MRSKSLASAIATILLVPIAVGYLPTAEKSKKVVVALNGWVFGVKSSGKWKAGTKALDGKSFRFLSFGDTKVGKSIHSTLEYTEGPPNPSVDMKDIEPSDTQTLYVSGSSVHFTPLKRVSKTDKEMLAVAKKYVASKHKSSLPLEIQDGVVADLNGDGNKEVVLSIGSGSSNSTKKSRDYSAIIVSTLVDGKPKILELSYETEFGMQRGPFKGTFIAAGDFDGSHKTTFVITSADSWGTDVKMLQLLKNGKLKQVWAAGFGE